MATNLILPSIVRQTESSAPCTQFIHTLSTASNLKKTMKILDIMVLSNNASKTPRLWLFTDTHGLFASQEISAMSLEDLIKAVVGNIEGSTIPLDHAEILV